MGTTTYCLKLSFSEFYTKVSVHVQYSSTILYSQARLKMKLMFFDKSFIKDYVIDIKSMDGSIREYQAATCVY